MYIEEKKLLDLLNRAFDEGYYGYGELKDSSIKKILDDFLLESKSTLPSEHVYGLFAEAQSDYSISSPAGTYALSTDDRLSTVPSNSLQETQVGINTNLARFFVTPPSATVVSNMENISVNISNNTNIGNERINIAR